jgi:hypothetical protein
MYGSFAHHMNIGYFLAAFMMQDVDLSFVGCHHEHP